MKQATFSCLLLLSYVLCISGIFSQQKPPPAQKTKVEQPKGDRIVDVHIELKGGGPVINRSIAFSSNGKFVAASNHGGESSAWVWSVEKSERVRDLPNKFDVREVAFSPNSKFFAATGSIGREPTRVWRTDPWELRHEFPSSWTLFFLPDSKTLALANADGLTLCDLETGKSKVTFDEVDVDKIISLAPSPDFSEFAMGFRDGRIAIRNAKTGKTKAKWQAHKGMVWKLLFAADGKSLLSAGHHRESGDDYSDLRYCRVHVWDAADGSAKKTLKVEDRKLSEINHLALIPQTNYVAVAGNGRWIHIYDLQSHREVMTLVGSPGPIRAMAVSADGRTVAGAYGVVRLWKLPEKRADPDKK